MYANESNSHTTTFNDEEQDVPQILGTCGKRIFRYFGIKVVTHPVPEEEDKDDECEFDIRVTDVPEDVLAANTEPDLLEMRFVAFGKNIWQRTLHKRSIGSLLLLLLLVILVSVSVFGHAPLKPTSFLVTSYGLYRHEQDTPNRHLGYLAVPSRAGSYAIAASWGQGHWLINFTAGQ